MAFIPVNEPLLKGNEKKYLNECIDTGWISSEGRFVKEFEEKFAEKVNRKYAITVANGSVALDIALKAIGIKAGDEVILPTFTIISCAAAIVNIGAKPVLVDADANTWNLDVTQIESKINSKTKAIMVVHIYGLPVDMDPVIELAKKYKLKIIEDAAEAHGLSYKQQVCGSFGDISTFSFYPNKLVTTGEGGMIVTNNRELAEKCLLYRNLCFVPHQRFVHEELGWNARMSNLQAAVGLAQLEQMESFVCRKREIGEKYNSLLNGTEDIQLPLEKTEYAENIYWVYSIVLQKNINAKEIMGRLAKEGIGTRPFFYPMHLQPVFKKMGLFKLEQYPVSERIAEMGFYIPSGLAITDKQIETVTNKLKIILSE